MNEEIGENAGKVWRFLSTEGETALSKLGKGVDLKKDDLLLALGWLAREGKLAWSGGKSPKVSVAG